MNNAANPWRTAFFLLLALVAVSFVSIDPPDKNDTLATGPGGAVSAVDDGELGDGLATDGATVDGTTDGSGSGGAAAGPAAGGPAAGGGAKAKNLGKLECKAGGNGGATDKGVTATRIKLASTNVRSGTGSSFLGSAYVGMQAVVNRVNAKGGICGRLLELRMVDDGWDGPKGAGFIENFAKQDYFALPVVPSSEGLTQAITTGIISKAGIPVVGSDGMLKEQYGDAWVWPVATATVSTMRIMAKHAYDSGARTFAIVYDERYNFGKEGATAYRDYVKTLPGTTMKAVQPIQPGKSSYAGEAKSFNDQCDPGGKILCDFVAMLLTPETANTYINSQQPNGDRKMGFGKVLTGGAQPLFNERFARDCAKACDGMLVWTGYNPPIGRLSSEPDVAAYVDDVQSVDPGVDETNQFLQGAYLGMKVFVAALEKVGPNLTRAGLRDALNSMTYQSTLASSLTWGPQVPQQRFANLSSQAFKVTTASGSFIGFAEANTGFLRDPTPGVVPKN